MHLLPLIVSVLPVRNIYFYDFKCMFSIPCTCFGFSLGLLYDAILAYADKSDWNYGFREDSDILHSLDAGGNQKWNEAVQNVFVDLSRTYSSFKIQVL